MKHELMNVFWPLLNLAIIVFVVLLLVRLYRFLGRRANTPPSNRNIINIFVPPLLLALIFSSCSKSVDFPENRNLTSQKLLLKELGFELKDISFEKNENSPQAPLVFKTLQEAKDFFNSVRSKQIEKVNVFFKETTGDSRNDTKRANGNITLSDVYSNGTEDYYSAYSPIKGSAYMVGAGYLWSQYFVSFNYERKLGNNLIEVDRSSVSSGMVGLVTGMSWDPLNTMSFTNYPNSALIYYNVSGRQNYNIIVESIGTIFSQVVVLGGIYNTNTKAYTIGIVQFD